VAVVLFDIIDLISRTAVMMGFCAVMDTQYVLRVSVSLLCLCDLDLVLMETQRTFRGVNEINGTRSLKRWG
jgi:hypothetical protein